MGKILNAGEIYTVNLDPTIGDEIRKMRPVVILNGGHEKHLRGKGGQLPINFFLPPSF